MSSNVGQCERLSLKDAAERLGISEGGVRARYRRGALKGERDDDGKIWVLVEPGAADRTGADRTGAEAVLAATSSVAALGVSACVQPQPSAVEPDRLAGTLDRIAARLDRIETLLATRPETATASIPAMTEERDELLFRIGALESLLDIAMRDHSAKLAELVRQLASRRPAFSDWPDWLRTGLATTIVRLRGLRIAFDRYWATALQIYGTARQYAARLIALR